MPKKLSRAKRGINHLPHYYLAFSALSHRWNSLCNRTTIGGLVPRDFSQCYDPKEYVLKRPMKGVYKIEDNFYGSSAHKLIGAVTLELENKREVIKVGEIKL